MNRSKHSLGSTKLTTCDLGQIVPIGMVPVLPGDTIGHSTNALVRVSPLAAPVMHQVDVRIHHFYCANRTLWNDNDGTDWEEFITGGEDGMNTDVVPTIPLTGASGDLFDQFGLPTRPEVAGIEVNALPIRAFNQIFNEYYRDQDLVAKRAPEDVTIPKCAWGRDYFTTARPFSQKGPSVSIPVGDSAPVISNTLVPELTSNAISGPLAQANTAGVVHLSASTGVGPTIFGAETGLQADLSGATGADPIDVRRAWGIQRFMEQAARFGNRYPEKMRQLGSTYRGLMDRPEYLGGGSQSVNFSEVLQTANGADPRFGVGDMYGHGIAAMRSNKYARTIGEHGYVISCLSVRPRTMYQDGIPREWLRQDREDFHDPYLELIGQQEVWANEIFADPLNTNADAWGFTDRYDEYRHTPSQVSGEFRDVLDYWHLGRKFATAPILNDVFIECDPSKRVFNEQTQNSLWIMAHHKIAAHRNVTKNATARLL